MNKRTGLSSSTKLPSNILLFHCLSPFLDTSDFREKFKGRPRSCLPALCKFRLSPLHNLPDIQQLPWSISSRIIKSSWLVFSLDTVLDNEMPVLRRTLFARKLPNFVPNAYEESMGHGTVSKSTFRYLLPGDN